MFGTVWGWHGRAPGHGHAVPHFWTELEKKDSGTVVPISTGRPCQNSIQARFRLCFCAVCELAFGLILGVCLGRCLGLEAWPIA